MAEVSLATSVVLKARAKINLALRVIRRLPDGYHQLDMLIGFAQDVGDAIEISPADDIHFDIDGPFAAALLHEDARLNLVTRAAWLLREATGVRAGAHIHLTKNLPVASGIGGGSADAAAVLTGLQRLWGTKLSHGALADLGLRLGADVPMCLYGAACTVGGIGEAITPLRGGLPGVVLLVNPGVKVATRPVFAALDLERTSGPLAPLPASFPTPQALACYVSAMGNDLAPASISIEPVIGDCISAIAATSGCLAAQMTGSGATCFGLFEDAATARAAWNRISRAHPDWWAAVSRLG